MLTCIQSLGSDNVVFFFLQDVSGKEKEILENEMKEKIGNRETAIAKAQKAKKDMNV